MHPCGHLAHLRERADGINFVTARMRAHELDEPRVHRRPDRSALVRGPALAPAGDARQIRHVLDGHLQGHLDGALLAGVDDLHPALRPPALLVELAAAEQPRDLLQRRLRGGEPDSLQPRGTPLGERRRAPRLEPLEGEEQVRAALRRGDRVDLVDDHRVDAPQGLAGLRGEQEVERLRRGDEDVGRPPLLPGALVRGGVSRADADLGKMEVDPEALRGGGDPGEGRAEVSLHVHRQRLDGRHVQHPAALLRLGHRREHHPVDGGEERREGLARAGRGEEEGRLRIEDRRPPEALGGGGLLEGGLEPGAGRRVEAGQGRAPAHAGLRGWQVGHQYVDRCCSPCTARSIVVPQS